MRAAVLRELGKPPKVEEFPEPTPADGEVLIHVSASALKAVDKQMATGTHYARPRELPVISGPTIALPAAVLRSTALTILGRAGIPPWDMLTAAFQQVVDYAARGKLRIDTEHVPLTKITDAWERSASGRRLVVVP